MTTVDPFITPAEAERADRTRQARDFLALAMTPESVSTEGWDQQGGYRRNYSNGVQAMRDAMVGQGYALVAVHAELADIAASLRTLASAPNALAEIGREIHDLTATVEQGVEFADSTAKAIREHAAVTESGLGDVSDQMWKPPSWWKRLWWKICEPKPEPEGKQVAAIRAAEASAPADLSHLYAKRDPSDPWDAIPFPGDTLTYPDRLPELLDRWVLDLVVAEHCQLTGGACGCGWCVYVEDPASYAIQFGKGEVSSS